MRMQAEAAADGGMGVKRNMMGEMREAAEMKDVREAIEVTEMKSAREVMEAQDMKRRGDTGIGETGKDTIRTGRKNIRAGIWGNTGRK